MEALYDESGSLVVQYIYDSWGKIISVSDTSGRSIGTKNPFRYRGYYYDEESGLYYLRSRYYDPEVGRFINADTTDVLSAELNLYDKNLFTYCDNNPVVRKDITGDVWETVFDIGSLGVSIVEVAVNPGDPWAWAGLVGDAVDLVPFVTGVGEATRVIKSTTRLVDTSNDVLKAAKNLKKNSGKANWILRNFI